MKKIYKILLLVWIVFGLSISGYLSIFPPKKWTEGFIRRSSGYNDHYYKGDYKPLQVCVLISTVGGVLILGVGKIDKPK